MAFIFLAVALLAACQLLHSCSRHTDAPEAPTHRQCHAELMDHFASSRCLGKPSAMTGQGRLHHASMDSQTTYHKLPPPRQ